MGEISVDPAWLTTPGDRFRRIASDLAAVAEALANATDVAAGAAGSSDVAAGCTTFATGMSAALAAFAEDTTLLRTKVAQAAITYRAADTQVAAAAAGTERPGPVPR
jgi:Excreted virulence factor EspC, type VII ESX diderm